MNKDLTNTMATEDNGKLPIKKEDMFTELRGLLLREAARIDLMRGPEATRAFLGFEYVADEAQAYYPLEFLNQIQLEDFEIARNFSLAYDYAFQVGEWMKFDETVEHRLRGVTESFPRFGVEGEQSPYYDDDSACRRISDLAVARYQLTHYSIMPTIEQLALLANMSPAAVRNSLSQEGIKPEGKPACIGNSVAWEWLSKRRGFIPNKTLDERKETAKEKTHRIFTGASFSNALRHAALEAGLTGKDDELCAGIAVASKTDEAFVRSLLANHPIADLGKLKAVSDALGLHNPRFTAVAIELALE